MPNHKSVYRSFPLLIPLKLQYLLASHERVISKSQQKPLYRDSIPFHNKTTFLYHISFLLTNQNPSPHEHSLYLLLLLHISGSYKYIVQNKPLRIFDEHT